METAEKRVSGKTVYDGKILKVVCDEVSLPDGKTSQREIVRHSGGACILAETDQGIALVSQFRYAYNEEILEIPAGKLKKDEDPASCALRECVEETGLKPLNLRKLGEIYPSPGYTDEIIHVYYADRFERVGQKLDEGEFLNLLFVDREKFFRMVFSGEIRDAKTVASAYYLKSASDVVKGMKGSD